MAVTGDGGAARRRHSVFPPALPPRTIPGRIPTAAGKACEEIAPPVFTFLRRPPVTQQGIVIFALQLLLIVLIPVLDDGGRLVPLPYAVASLAVAMLTVAVGLMARNSCTTPRNIASTVLRSSSGR